MFKLDVRDKDLVPQNEAVEILGSQWKKPGDTNIFDNSVFAIVKVTNKLQEKDSYLLQILAPGLETFDLVRLNFKTGSIGYFV